MTTHSRFRDNMIDSSHCTHTTGLQPLLVYSRYWSCLYTAHCTHSLGQALDQHAGVCGMWTAHCTHSLGQALEQHAGVCGMWTAPLKYHDLMSE